MILDNPPARRKAVKQYQTTTIRQFDGGWNVIDNELTLNPRFARILDNFVRGPDGSQSVRYGYGLWKDLKTGVEATVNVSPTLTTVLGSRRLKFNWVAHGLSSGNHVGISGAPSVNGIPDTEINGNHNVRVIDANSFDVIVTTPATSAGTTAAIPLVVVKDTHIAGGDVVNGIYFADFIVVVTEVGEVISINGQQAASLIWDNAAAFALSGNPVGWGRTEFVSFNVFGGKLKIHNGIDKPIEVDFNNTPIVVFLGDPASGGSNAFVPVGRIGFSTGGYAMITGIADDPSKLQFSAQLADGVWTGNPAPADAVDVDLSKVTVSFDSDIVGVGELRDKLVVCFRDSISIGTLGITKVVGSATLHDPQFKDSIPQHGTISHRSIISLGNDLFMCDRVGIPSVSLSQLSSTIVPERVSDFVEPALQANISRLTNETLANKVFAVYNTGERQYMLFMPRFDPEDERNLKNNPITIVEEMDDTFIIEHQGHNLEAGDDVVIDDCTDVGGNAAALFNKQHKVNAVIDENFFTIISDTPFTDRDVTGGGPDVKLRAITDETNAYIYSYNPKLKVRSWSRFRGLNFVWGVRSAHGQLFFGKGGKIYRWGNQQYPYSADQVDDYDYLQWAAGTDYIVGDRVYDVIDDTVYVALKAHEAAGASFSAARAADEELWEEYIGNPISFTWEWPWGDFDKRLKTKTVGAIYPDSSGSGQFSIKMFVDQLYKDSAGNLTPVRELAFTGGGAGGYGAGGQPYGSGRRSKEQAIWPVPVLCKLAKFRIEGETTDPLRIIALSILYKEGSLKR